MVITKVIPIIAAVLITIFAYWLTIKRLKAFPKNLLSTFGLETGKLFWYPAVLILTFAPCIAYSFTMKLLDREGSLITKAMHLMLTHGIGFSNAIVYGIQSKKKKEMDYLEIRGSNFEIDDDDVSVEEELRRGLN